MWAGRAAQCLGRSYRHLQNRMISCIKASTESQAIPPLYAVLQVSLHILNLPGTSEVRLELTIELDCLLDMPQAQSLIIECRKRLRHGNSILDLLHCQSEQGRGMGQPTSRPLSTFRDRVSISADLHSA